MNKRLWLLVDLALLGIIFAYSSPSFPADVLQPVASGGLDWWPVIVFGGMAAIVAGLIFWHRRNPSQEAAALHEAHAGLISLTHDIGALVDKIRAKHEAKEHPPAPTPEQLAAVAAASNALNSARHEAGLPPLPLVWNQDSSGLEPEK